MRRVVHVINHLGWGGAENLVRGMTRHLARRGWEVAVCALSQPVHAPDGVPVHCLGARGPWDAVALIRLWRLLRRLRPEVVHLHLLWAELWGVPAALGAGARVVITAHCTQDARAASRLIRLCSRAATRAAAATIAISHSVAQYRIACCGDPPQRMRVIPNGVELTQWAVNHARASARARLGFPPRARVVGTVARLHPVKGVDTFIGAAALLARWHEEARFVVVGGGPQEADLRHLASSLGLDRRMVFTGEMAARDVREMLAAMDVFVLPSVHEGLGIAAIEAMAAGLPVVASECDGIREVVEEGRTGLLFAPGDARALAGKVDALLRRPEWGRRLGAAGQRRAGERFSLEDTVTQVEQVYGAALEARGGAHKKAGRITLIGGNGWLGFW